ncbi:MAG: class I SAM-dependent methyltransferase [Eubacterium sp.]|nr:class I SAM-dependent methyltransferase [Eubacterium sp.]
MTDSNLHIYTEEIQMDGKDNYHCHRYEPTPYPVLDQLFDYYQPGEDEVLVDYGSGLGRLNFYVAHRLGIQSVGVEFSREYYQRALANLETFQGKKDKISFCLSRAEDYLVSKVETCFYFFNPFSLDIFRQVINRILDSWEEVPRKLTLVLYYPEDDVIFYLAHHTFFLLVDEIAAGPEIEKDRRERFCIYQLSAGPQ